MAKLSEWMIVQLAASKRFIGGSVTSFTVAPRSLQQPDRLGHRRRLVRRHRRDLVEAAGMADGQAPMPALRPER